MNAMRYTLFASVAALFLAMGTAHAGDKLPETMLGRWCQASLYGNVRMLYYRNSFVGKESPYCSDFDDGITLSQDGFSDDSPRDDWCGGYVFDKIVQTEDGYIVSVHCEEPRDKYNPAEDNLAGTWQVQHVFKDLLMFTRMPEG